MPLPLVLSENPLVQIKSILELKGDTGQRQRQRAFDFEEYKDWLAPASLKIVGMCFGPWDSGLLQGLDRLPEQVKEGGVNQGRLSTIAMN